MKTLIFLLLLFFSLTAPLSAKKKVVLPHREIPTLGTEDSLETLLHSLDPHSVAQHLAFYQLYPTSIEGKKALSHALELLGEKEGETPTELPIVELQEIINLITRASFDSQIISLSEEQLTFIKKLSASLHHHSLKGHGLYSKKEVLTLPDEQTDLARTLLLFQIGDDPTSLEKIAQYEAQLDLMALQIRSRLSKKASHQEKMKEINHFIFHEMQFRFPPQSAHAADIDLYTFLPSVLDGRQGVCLGVSILYLCLSQRLDLPLEIITPPGHIYVRYNNGKELINIETTARGINTPSDMYLGINTKSLKKRGLKEVVGLAFMNEASVHWSNGKFARSLSCYETAKLFMPEDPLLKMFLGFSYLFNGQTSKGASLLKQIANSCAEEAIAKETIPEDYLAGRVDAEGIKTVFLQVDATRSSILEKQKKLERCLERYPLFRAGLLQLATTWLQLNRTKEAKAILERYHKLDPHNVIVEYYLSVLCFERLDYNESWEHLKILTSLLQAKQHNPPALVSLRQSLSKISP
ncbi:MAG: hypothetical protein RLZZ453_396 [Chlamydiota bacterium]|jgi:tetratricopeptide (TPR) repeat protein